MSVYAQWDQKFYANFCTPLQWDDIHIKYTHTHTYTIPAGWDSRESMEKVYYSTYFENNFSVLEKYRNET